jgi:hypothetical protein
MVRVNFWQSVIPFTPEAISVYSAVALGETGTSSSLRVRIAPNGIQAPCLDMRRQDGKGDLLNGAWDVALRQVTCHVFTYPALLRSVDCFIPASLFGPELPA